MTRFFYITSISAAFFSCDQPASLSNESRPQPTTPTVTVAQSNQPLNTIPPGKLFTLTDAENILGEPAHLSDSSSAIKGDPSVYSCAYSANTKDSKSGKTGNVYLTFEKYIQDSSAKHKYSFIYNANKDHGTNKLHDMGDEAYFHTDRENFYFIMARKGTCVFSMKVNKITSKTSLNEFNLAAKKISDSL